MENAEEIALVGGSPFGRRVILRGVALELWMSAVENVRSSSLAMLWRSKVKRGAHLLAQKPHVKVSQVKVPSHLAVDGIHHVYVFHYDNIYLMYYIKGRNYIVMFIKTPSQMMFGDDVIRMH